MKKIVFLLLAAIILGVSTVYAQSMVSDERNSSLIKVSYASYPDYEPLAYIQGVKKYKAAWTIFDQAIKTGGEARNIDFEIMVFKDFKQATDAALNGKVDFLIGNYYDPKLQNYVDYIYPAVLSNPVHVAVLPENKEKIKSAGDLKNLRGIYVATDQLNDFVLNNLQQLQAAPAESLETAYRMLFAGEVDYVIGGFYYLYVYACQNGLKDYVYFTKSPLWNMAMFATLSKKIRGQARIKKSIEKMVVLPEFKQLILQSLQERVREAELLSQQIVPPDYVRYTGPAALTPADEEAAK